MSWTRWVMKHDLDMHLITTTDTDDTIAGFRDSWGRPNQSYSVLIDQADLFVLTSHVGDELFVVCIKNKEE